MEKIALEIPEDVLLALRKDKEEFKKELLLTAAAKWYELGIVSQDKAAGIANLSRAEFIMRLGQLQVSPFQYSIDEVKKEAKL